MAEYAKTPLMVITVAYSAKLDGCDSWCAEHVKLTTALHNFDEARKPPETGGEPR